MAPARSGGRVKYARRRSPETALQRPASGWKALNGKGGTRPRARLAPGMPAASLRRRETAAGERPRTAGRSSPSTCGCCRRRRARTAGRRARPRGQRGSDDAGAARRSTRNGSGEHSLARARRASRSRRGYGPRRSRRAERQWGRQAGSGTAERGRRAGRRRAVHRLSTPGPLTRCCSTPNAAGRRQTAREGTGAPLQPGPVGPLCRASTRVCGGSW